MHRGVVLRHNGSECSDGRLCSRLILGRLCKCLYKLYFRIIFIIRFSNQLFKLSHGLVSSLNRINDMLRMPRGVVLRHDGFDGSDGCLRSRLILSFLFKCLFKLFFGSVFIIRILNQLLELP